MPRFRSCPALYPYSLHFSLPRCQRPPSGSSKSSFPLLKGGYPDRGMMLVTRDGNFLPMSHEHYSRLSSVALTGQHLRIGDSVYHWVTRIVPSDNFLVVSNDP